MGKAGEAMSGFTTHYVTHTVFTGFNGKQFILQMDEVVAVRDRDPGIEVFLRGREDPVVFSITLAVFWDQLLKAVKP